MSLSAIRLAYSGGRGVQGNTEPLWICSCGVCVCAVKEVCVLWRSVCAVKEVCVLWRCVLWRSVCCEGLCVLWRSVGCEGVCATKEGCNVKKNNLFSTCFDKQWMVNCNNGLWKDKIVCVYMDTSCKQTTHSRYLFPPYKSTFTYNERWTWDIISGVTPWLFIKTLRLKVTRFSWWDTNGQNCSGILPHEGEAEATVNGWCYLNKSSWVAIFFDSLVSTSIASLPHPPNTSTTKGMHDHHLRAHASSFLECLASSPISAAWPQVWAASCKNCKFQ